MRRRKQTKLVQAERYVADVDVELIDDDTGWVPFLTPEDAFKPDDVRAALRRGDLHSAPTLRVYSSCGRWRRVSAYLGDNVYPQGASPGNNLLGDVGNRVKWGSNTGPCIGRTVTCIRAR
jgi:hypothetical protein